MSAPLLSSDVWKLVLGHLRAEGCAGAAAALVEEEPRGTLKEIQALERRGRKVDLKFKGRTLKDMLEATDE